MKPKRPQIHLLNVSEPLLAYCNLIMRCGQELKNAVPKFMVAKDVEKEVLRPYGICRKCLETPPELSDESRYEYGLMEAQEEKDANLEEMAECAA